VNKAVVHHLTSWLSKQPSWVFSIFAITASFCTYACMYAFRKPYSAAAFEGYENAGMELKTALIISQVIGYTLSKFLGIKFVSEMPAHRRIQSILGLIVFSELALLGLWKAPVSWSWFFLLLNGLPLGMVWGLVFSFLEGRRNTELLGAGLSVSFIVSSGIVKSSGLYLMLEFGLSDFAMPFFTGLLFVPLLLLSLWALHKIPPPITQDEEERTKRVPMSSKERWAFFKRFWPGLVLLTVVYMALSAYRDLRDNYALEIFEAIGYKDNAAIFTQTEAPIALVVLVIIASLMFIKDNQKALRVNHYMIGGGIALIGTATLAFSAEWISPYWWMVLIGLGSYLGYVPFNCILFDRFIATFKSAANAGFLIYLADSFGYLSSVGLLLFKNFLQTEISWYDFFLQFSYSSSVLGVILTLISLWYFMWNAKHQASK
jgi:hypothetical protein